MDRVVPTEDQRVLLAQHAEAARAVPATILAECAALRHNTLTAAQRGIRGKPGAERCICPRAVQLRAEALERQRALRNAKGRATTGEGRRFARSRAKPVKDGVRAPNLYGAPCTTPAGLTLLEQASNRQPNSPKARVEFQRMCLTQCPKLAECDAWLRAAENPPGSWGRIYAGLTANDRRRREQ